MIDPLRLNKEYAPPFPISQPVFCGMCLISEHNSTTPNMAIKHCNECPRFFLCGECDESNHKSGVSKDHLRRILVVGPAVRKKVITRGDARNFPLPLDEIEIRLKARVYHEGKLVHREKPQHLKFISGLSGNCIHVQVLGCRNLIAADLSGNTPVSVCFVFSSLFRVTCTPLIMLLFCSSL